MVRTAPQLLIAIRAYAAELERHGVPVERIILYGSHAHGTPRPDSDIDLAVFSEQFGAADHRELSGVLSAGKWNTEPLIEAIGFHPAALRNVPRISFLHKIVSTGQVVYQRGNHRS